MMNVLNVVSFLIGVVSLALTIFYGRQGQTAYQAVMGSFDQKVMDLLTRVLEKGRLSTDVQTRGLIRNVAAEYGINMPSDEYIVRILRRLALQYEQGEEDQQAKLIKLEEIRKELEPKGPPLMSIASVNHWAALQLMMGAAILFLIVYQILYLSHANWIMSLISSILEVVIALAMYSVSRLSRRLSKKLE